MNKVLFWNHQRLRNLVVLTATVVLTSFCKASSQRITPLHVIKNHNSSSLAVFSPDGKVVAIGDGDKNDGKGILTIWDARTGKLKRVLQRDVGPFSIAFSSTGQILASVSGGMKFNTMNFWNTQTGLLVKTVPYHNRKGFQSVAFSSDRKEMAAGSSDVDARGQSKVVLWEVHTAKIKRILQGFSFQTGISSIAFSPDGALLVGASNSSEVSVSEICIWETRTGKLRETLTTEGEEGAVSQLAFSSTGKIWASVGDAIALRATNTGKLLWLHKVAYRVNSVDFSPDGKILATGEQGDDGAIIKIWDTRTGKLKHFWQAHRALIHGLDFSSNGKLLVSASEDKTVKIWRIK